MTAAEGFYRAVACVCVAIVVVFMIRCSQANDENGRCSTFTSGTISCSGAACEHCQPLEKKP